MADVTKTVELEFTGDIGKLKKAMKQASSFQKDMQRTSKVMRKEGLRGYKDMEKATKMVAKHDKGRLGTNALKRERDLQRAVKETTRALKAQARVRGANSAAVRKEHQELKRVTAQLQKHQSLRRGMGIRTGRERLASAGRKSGEFLSGMSGVMATVAKQAAFAGAGAALGVVTSQVQASYQSRMQYGQAYGQLAGLSGKGGGYKDLTMTGRGAHMRERAARLGFAPAEMAGMAGGVARATGRLGGQDLTTAMQFKRATGQDASGIMGQLTQAGQNSGSMRNEMVKTLALGMHKGLERARMPEFFGGVMQLVQQQSGIQAGDVSSLGFARLFAQMQMSGQSGLQGARGAAVAGKLNKGIQQPGGGEAGQALMLQAFGFGKPGSSTSYYDALLKQEQGASPENVKAVFGEASRQYGGGEAGALALKEIFGISLTQAEQMRRVIESGGPGVDKELAAIESGAPGLSGQAKTQMGRVGDTTKHMAELENRLVNMGEKFKKPIETLQRVLNEAVDESSDMIKAALEKVAEAVVELRDWAVENFGTDARETAAKNIAAAEGTLRNQLGAHDLAGAQKTVHKMKLDAMKAENALADAPGYIEWATGVGAGVLSAAAAGLNAAVNDAPIGEILESIPEGYTTGVETVSPHARGVAAADDLEVAAERGRTDYEAGLDVIRAEGAAERRRERYARERLENRVTAGAPLRGSTTPVGPGIVGEE